MGFVDNNPKSGMCDTYILETKELVASIFTQRSCMLEHLLQRSNFEYDFILLLCLRIFGRLVRRGLVRGILSAKQLARRGLASGPETKQQTRAMPWGKPCRHESTWRKKKLLNQEEHTELALLILVKKPAMILILRCQYWRMSGSGDEGGTSRRLVAATTSVQPLGGISSHSCATPAIQCRC